MTLVKGVPVVEQTDVQTLMPLWKPDPAGVQKQTDDIKNMNNAQSCAYKYFSDARNTLTEGQRRSELNDLAKGTFEEKATKSANYIASNKC